MHPLNTGQILPNWNPIDFECPFCQQNLSSPPELFGHTLACPSCSNSFIVPTPDLPTPAYQFSNLNPPGPNGGHIPKTSRLAVGSLICGILGFVTGITALVGIVLGHLSLTKIKASKGLVGGKRLATWGLVASYLSILAAVTFGIADYSMARTTRYARLSHANSDFDTYKSCLLMYKLSAGIFPTPQQGLQALVSKPTTMPVPKRWKKILNTLPVDPWGNAYGYRIQNGSYEVTTNGPDGVVDTADDRSFNVGSVDALSPEVAKPYTIVPSPPISPMTTAPVPAKPEPLKSIPKAKDIYAKTGEEALSEARRFMVGTWTYTGQEYQFLGTVWIKWVINEDGTMEDYTPQATADGWGEPKSQEWEIITSKYSNTGKRFYAFRIKGHVTFAIIGQDGSVIYKVAEGSMQMARGDAFPFSK